MNRIQSPKRIPRPLRTAERSWSQLRFHVAVPFRNRGIGVDPVTAQQRSNSFFRASGMPWTQALG